MSKANIRAIYISDKEQAKREIELIKADLHGIKLMAPKAVHRVLKLEAVPVKVANIIKQEALSKGAEAAVARGTVDHSIAFTDVLLMGTEKQLRQICNKLRIQPFGLAKIAEEVLGTLDNLNKREKAFLKCRKYSLELGHRTLIMGILNVTPDSFSDGGKYNLLDQAVLRAEEMIAQGADIIDVGAESTRPKATPVSLDQELERVLPVVRELAKRVEAPISVDTYKAEVARRALEMGAHMINDVWGAQREPEIAKVASEYQVPLVVMHNQAGTEYKDLMGDITRFLNQSISICLEGGMEASQIILDPGIGFGKTYEQNLEVMNQLEQLKTFGKPILLGTSRKSIIGNTLQLPADQRVEGTAATIAYGITKGADIVRVHDITEMKRVVKMTDAMVRR